MECFSLFVDVCLHVCLCVCACSPLPHTAAQNHRDRTSRIPTQLPRRREASIDCRAALLWKPWMPTGRGPPLIRANERRIDRMRDREKTTVSLDVRARHSVYSQSRFCPVFREALPSFLHGWIIAASLFLS